MVRAVAVLGELALLLLLASCPGGSSSNGGTLPGTGPTPVATADAAAATPPAPPARELALNEEVHLKNVRQLTFGGENAEAYWSFGGDRLIMQSLHGDFKCDQIFTIDVAKALAGGEAAADTKLVSTGKGRTTCSYYLPGDKDILYASTHAAAPECPTPPDHSMGYVWGLFDSYDIYRAAADGSNPTKITDAPGYDAEATVCAKTGQIIFTSVRDGDLELYKMDADGKNVQRLTHAVGYDGGAFFSADCSKIVWRASRPTGKSLEDYKALLAKNLVRPTQLEIFVANADGSDARQVTYLGAASFAPYLTPSGNRILFSTNYPNPRGREFDIWAIDTDGTDLERITYAEGFDGFPMFSPDGKKLAFASNRRDVVDGTDGAKLYRVTNTKVGETDTNVFVADWVESPPKVETRSSADRFLDIVAFLADDAREGRGLGTKGLADAVAYTAKELEAAGVEPGVDGKFTQSFEVVTAIARGAGTKLVIDGVAVADDQFAPLSFSGKGPVTAAPVRAAWGIDDAKVGMTDYKGVKAKGAIAVVHRFTPSDPKFDKDNGHLRLGDLERKAFTARQKGAIALIVVDDGDPKAEEAKLPTLEARASADAGIPVVAVTRAVAAKLDAAKSVELAVELTPVRTTTDNVIGVIKAGAAKKLPGIVVVGAHVDHLGPTTHHGSLEGKPGIHNGADDNASGVAAMIEVARTLAANKANLARDVYFMGFSGEESGLLGSAYVVKHMPTKAKVVAMLNMDMVGRMRANQLLVLGVETAPQWKGLLETACADARVDCQLSGSGYGPSDQMSFYIAGAPVLHFFTGGHLDYHKSSDDTSTINAAGGAKTADIVAAVTAAVAGPKAPKLAYKKIAAPPPMGDLRKRGASLGTIPAYNEDPTAPPGMLISDVVPGGPAQKAGLKGGDRIVLLGSIEVRNVHDLMFVLTNAKPGEAVKVTIMRDGKKLVVDATYAAPRSR
jgi:Tol biopolymer transport system component